MLYSLSTSDNNLSEVRRLLSEGADPNDAGAGLGRTPVHYAALYGAAEVLRALIGAGGDPAAPDFRGDTALHLGAQTSAVLHERDSIGILRALLELPKLPLVDPNTPNQEGKTALHLVAYSNHTSAVGVELLLAAGADPNRADGNGATPLHAAVVSPFGPDVVAALLAGGAGAGAVDGDGLTPLLRFLHGGVDNGRIVDLLLDAGADPDGKDPSGNAPLHLAIRGSTSGQPEVVDALLAGGADPCAQDARGFTPYQIADEGGRAHTALARADGHDLACDREREAVAAREAEEYLGLDSALRRRIQERLAEEGFDPGPADGAFGPRTRSAIAGWQEERGAAATGYLDEESMQALLGDAAAVDVAALQPLCDGLAEGAECWQELSNTPGCHVWDGYYVPDRTVAWSGACSGGLAQGRGTASWGSGAAGDHQGLEATGVITDGKMHGQWVVRRADGDVSEGPYVDGKRHGQWVFRRANGGGSEGPYVDGKRHGQWVFRRANGGGSEGPYVDGKRHGQWVVRRANGGGFEGPYVDGERHGQWVLRWGDGGGIEGPYVDGKQHGQWVYRYTSGIVEEGPYVDGKQHGQWVLRYTSGIVEEVTYVDGKLQVQ